MKIIFIFGSINMDLSIECSRLPAKGETLQGRSFLESPGGKGANQAVSAAKTSFPCEKAGEPFDKVPKTGQTKVYMIARVGNDRLGAAVIETLRSYNVDTTHILQDGSSTGVAVIVRSEGDNRIICDYGANHEIDSSYAIEVLQKNAKAGDIFLTQLECRPEEVFATLVEAKRLGLVTIFNPAPAMSLPAELYKHIDYIVVNQTECAMLTGIHPKTAEESYPALDYFREQGVANPIITLGELGSVWHGVHYLSVPVDVVDTTAAGDAYIGAFASSLAAGKQEDSALGNATLAAAITITRLGAQQAVPTLEEIEEFGIQLRTKGL
ncbi:MAG: ribokinase [Deferribacteraceae bacterium]|jgi:ribokinase|nr:ribokinase [Deferribacteraceae bacterium]